MPYLLSSRFDNVQPAQLNLLGQFLSRPWHYRISAPLSPVPVLQIFQTAHSLPRVEISHPRKGAE